MIRLERIPEEHITDLAMTSNGIANDGDLETAVIISLLTDRRAEPDDILPELTSDKPSILPADRRGWVGDAIPDVAGDRIGSRLWLLSRAKQTEETRKQAIEYAKEALQWLIDDGHVKNITIDARWIKSEVLALSILLNTVNRNFNIDISVGIGGNTYAL